MSNSDGNIKDESSFDDYSEMIPEDELSEDFDDTYDENEIRYADEQIERENRKNQKKAEAEQKRKRKAVHKTKRYLVFNMAVIFILGMIVIFRYARITEIGYKTDEIVSEYNSILKENEKIDVYIERQTNLSEIREYAEKELGMSSPNASQIIHISSATTDRVSSTFTDRETKGIVQKTIEWLKRFFGYTEDME